jgi:PPOX class probable F420-dependent enzyme
MSKAFTDEEAPVPDGPEALPPRERDLPITRVGLARLRAELAARSATRPSETRANASCTRERERRRERMATNRRQQIQLSPDEQAAFFRERKKAALATIDKDGFPHVVAMNYVARDGAFYMTSYGKAQKVVNIRRNPKVALMIEAGDEYAELRGVMIRGRCEILDDEASVRAAFAARAGAQADASPVQPGALASAPKRVVLRIVPETVISWDHRKLGGRY